MTVVLSYYLLCSHMLTQIFDHLPITRHVQSFLTLQEGIRIACNQVKLITLSVVQKHLLHVVMSIVTCICNILHMWATMHT